MKHTKHSLSQSIILCYNNHGVVNSKLLNVHKNVIRYHFGSLKQALIDLKIENGKILTTCEHCSKQFKSNNFENRKYCSRSCSAKVNNTTRIPKQKKPVLTKKQKWLKTVAGPYIILKHSKCKHCGCTIVKPKKTAYCDVHKNLYSSHNRKRYRFEFNLYHYPDLFDLKSLSEKGFYDGTSSTTHKMTRDHRVSITEAIKYNYNPYYISHPMNCELMSWSDNIKKGIKSSITYEQLVEFVDNYDAGALNRI